MFVRNPDDIALRNRRAPMGIRIEPEIGVLSERVPGKGKTALPYIGEIKAASEPLLEEEYERFHVWRCNSDDSIALEG